MNELNESRISVLIHIAVGVVVGYASVLLNSGLYAFGLAVLVLIVTGYATEFILKKKGIKWWISNGGIFYLLVWVISWIFFFNITL